MKYKTLKNDVITDLWFAVTSEIDRFLRENEEEFRKGVVKEVKSRVVITHKVGLDKDGVMSVTACKDFSI